MESPTIHHFDCFFSPLLFDLCVSSLLRRNSFEIVVSGCYEMEVTPEVTESLFDRSKDVVQ